MIMIITTPEFNNVAPGVSDARSKQADLVTKTDFDTKLRSLNQKINSNKTKHLLVKNELKKAENIWFGLFWKIILNGAQNYLVFPPKIFLKNW